MSQDPKKIHLLGRFSGRLATKEDEKKLAEECRLLGPLLGGTGKNGDKSRQTLAKIVRGIASGEVRKYCADRERQNEVLKLQLVELEHTFQNQMREMQARMQALQADLSAKERYIAHLEEEVNMTPTQRAALSSAKHDTYKDQQAHRAYQQGHPMPIDALFANLPPSSNPSKYLDQQSQHTISSGYARDNRASSSQPVRHADKKQHSSDGHASPLAATNHPFAQSALHQHQSAQNTTNSSTTSANTALLECLSAFPLHAHRPNVHHNEIHSKHPRNDSQVDLTSTLPSFHPNAAHTVSSNAHSMHGPQFSDSQFTRSQYPSHRTQPSLFSSQSLGTLSEFSFLHSLHDSTTPTACARPQLAPPISTGVFAPMQQQGAYLGQESRHRPPPHPTNQLLRQHSSLPTHQQGTQQSAPAAPAPNAAPPRRWSASNTVIDQLQLAADVGAESIIVQPLETPMPHVVTTITTQQALPTAVVHSSIVQPGKPEHSHQWGSNIHADTAGASLKYEIAAEVLSATISRASSLSTSGDASARGEVNAHKRGWPGSDGGMQQAATSSMSLPMATVPGSMNTASELGFFQQPARCGSSTSDQGQAGGSGVPGTRLGGGEMEEMLTEVGAGLPSMQALLAAGENSDQQGRSAHHVDWQSPSGQQQYRFTQGQQQQLQQQVDFSSGPGMPTNSSFSFHPTPSPLPVYQNRHLAMGSMNFTANPSPTFARSFSEAMSVDEVNPFADASGAAMFALAGTDELGDMNPMPSGRPLYSSLTFPLLSGQAATQEVPSARAFLEQQLMQPYQHQAQQQQQQQTLPTQQQTQQQQARQSSRLGYSYTSPVGAFSVGGIFGGFDSDIDAFFK